MPSLPVVVFVVVVIVGVGHVEAGVGSNGFDNQMSEAACRRPVTNGCHSVNTTCYGMPLSYTETSGELIKPDYTIQQILSDMQVWEGLQKLPRCWVVLQPLLCTYYMPRCQNNTIDKPSQELCKRARNPCRVIEESLKQLPAFLDCDDTERFHDPNLSCKGNERVVNGTTTAHLTCMAPMLRADSPFNHFDGFEGCALPCQTDTLYSQEDNEFVSTFIKYIGSITLIATGAVVATFIIDWPRSDTHKVYPSIIVFYVNVCYFVATCGWMIQFLPNAKEDIVCRKDLTIRRQEPATGQSVFCLLVFILTYLGSMAALAWLVVFAYCWNLTCNAVGRIQEQIDKKSLAFHTFCWAIPFVLTVACVSLSAVDANSLTGVCYVSFTDSYLRISFVIVPIVLAVSVMLLFLWRGICRLISVSWSSSDFISTRGRVEIKSQALRMGFFTVGATVLIFAFVAFQWYEIQKRPIWAKSQRDFFVCKLNLTQAAECEVAEKPTLNFIIWSIAIYFFGGLLVSMWAWTSASVRTWRRFLSKMHRRFKSDNSLDQLPNNVAKHKLIAQAFAKRHQFPVNGRLSINLYSAHEDPIGLNRLLDPNHLCQEGDGTEMDTHNNTNTDAQEEEISEWAAGLPHLVTRRGAIIPPHSSNSVSCVSEDSRRPSCDSAVSEIAIRNLQGSSHHDDRHHKKRSIKDKFGMGRRNRSGKIWSFRRGNGGSSSSLESNPGSQILPAITALIDKRSRNPNDDEVLAPLNNAPLTGPTSRKPIIMKELAVQTSLEKLPFLSQTTKNNSRAYQSPSNNLTSDKATQSSLLSLHEIGTQTKKSVVKKGDKDRQKSRSKTDKGKKKNNDEVVPEPEDPVLKLLTPN